MRALLSALGGAAASLVLVLSCSDDSPQDVDAAVNCEPPLAGRIMRIEDVQSNKGSAVISGAANCPTGATLLGGGCELAGPNVSTLQLNMAGYGSANGSYACQWQNPSAITVEMAKSWAVCLIPAT